MGSSKALHSKRYTAFRALLVKAREDAGLTQAQAALAIGQPQNFVSKCERGERRVDAVELEDFATTYRVPMGYFATRDMIETVRVAKRQPRKEPRST